MKKTINFQYDVRMSAPGVYDVDVGGVISDSKWDDTDVTAKDFGEALKAAQGADKVNIHINSPGGCVTQAVAMRQMLMACDAKEKHVYVDGLCASAATLLTCIDAPVHMAQGAVYMIHNPSMVSWGDYRQMQHDADVLDKLTDNFADIYSAHSKQDKEQIRAWMDDETWFTANEALKNGFVSDITAVEAVACADMDGLKEIYAHVPAAWEGLPRQPTAQAKAKPENINNREEKPKMNWQEVTMDVLRAERPDLVSEVEKSARAEERNRIQAIDEAAGITDEAANDAKYVNPCDAGAYALKVLKAQHERGNKYIEQRAQETAQMKNVKPEPISTSITEHDDTDALAKAIANSIMGGVN